MYLQYSLKEEYYEKIKNGAQTLEILKNNVKIPVKSINGKKSIDYIQVHHLILNQNQLLIVSNSTNFIRLKVLFQFQMKMI